MPLRWSRVEEAPPTCEDSEAVEEEEELLVVMGGPGAVSHWGTLRSVVIVSTFTFSVCVPAWAR